MAKRIFRVILMIEEKTLRRKNKKPPIEDLLVADLRKKGYVLTNDTVEDISSEWTDEVEL